MTSQKQPIYHNGVEIIQGDYEPPIERNIEVLIKSLREILQEVSESQDNIFDSVEYE